MFMISEA